MRMRLLVLSSSGFCRSLGVMLCIMASRLLKALSSMSTSLRALPTPGIMAARSFRLPIFLICSICFRKSSKSNLFFCIFFCRRRASSSSNCSWARSTSDTTSPIPSMRSAMRVGWNTSIASIFSPVPINLMGLVTTVRMLRAAPPRVSPSSLVSTTPLKSSRSLNSLAVFTASCPVMESTTKRVSSGFTWFFKLLISFIICSSMANRPAVSMMTTSLPRVLASCRAWSAIESTSLFSGSLYTGTPICSPTTRNCSMAAGR